MKILYCSLLVLLFSIPVLSQWSGDPTINNPICTHSSYQYDPSMISDGSGGAIIVWEDDRNANADGGYNYDIYAQRIDVNGILKWTVDGIGVCTAAHTQQKPVIASDGSGGAIIAWEDSRLTGTAASYFDIYAQRINGNGVAMWTADGVRVTTASTVADMHNPAIITSETHGAIVAWEDLRTGGYRHIYVQKLDPTDGHSIWATDGLNVCTNATQEREVVMISDGSNGAILTWEDFRDAWRHTYAQRIDNSGTLLWTNDALGVCTTTGENQYTPTLATDGSGGAIFTYHNDALYIYAQRVNLTGGILWATGGVVVTNISGNATYPNIVSDGSNGAIIAWYENRGGNPTFDDIYAQRVAASDGHSMWTSGGVAVCALAQNQFYARLTTDGSGGAIISWSDYRGGGSLDIYAQRVDPTDGHSLWTANGVAVSTPFGDQKFTNDPGTQTNSIVNDPTGTIITWLDQRSGNAHVYVSKLSVAGVMPVELTSFTAKNLGDRITLTWRTATEVNNMGFEVERRINNSAWKKLKSINGNENSNSPNKYSFTDVNPGNGKIEYRLKQIDISGNYKYSNTVEVITVVPSKFELAQNYPNPFNPSTVIKYSLAKPVFVTIKIYDELGKEITTLVNENKDAGFYNVTFNASGMPSGVYLYKINAGTFNEAKKLILAK